MIIALQPGHVVRIQLLDGIQAPGLRRPIKKIPFSACDNGAKQKTSQIQRAKVSK